MAVVVRALVEAGAATVTFEKLRERTRIPAHELEDTLARMTAEGVLMQRDGRSGYRLAEQVVVLDQRRSRPPGRSAVHVVVVGARGRRPQSRPG